MASSRTSFGLVIGAVAVVLALGGILFATGYLDGQSVPKPPIHKEWQTVSNGDITFKFPENTGTTYITTSDWPPQIQIIDGPFSCTTAGATNMSAGKTESQTINGREYCVTTESEGTAGSIYLLYTYAFPIDDPSVDAEKVAIFTFGLREVQCANYDEPKKTECENERAMFDISGAIDEMAQTIQFVRN